MLCLKFDTVFEKKGHSFWWIIRIGFLFAVAVWGSHNLLGLSMLHSNSTTTEILKGNCNSQSFLYVHVLVYSFLHERATRSISSANPLLIKELNLAFVSKVKDTSLFHVVEESQVHFKYHYSWVECVQLTFTILITAYNVH